MNVAAMFKKARTMLAAVVLSGVVLAPAASAAEPPVPVIPLPAQVATGQGEFVLTARTAIGFAAGDEQARQAADQFAELLRDSRGVRPVVLAGAASAGAVTFATDSGAPAGAEAYTLSIRPQGVRVRARTAAGLFYGGVTLWQLLTADGGRSLPVRVKALEITDAPRFAWRGFMLDSARHLQSVDEIKQLLDQMARHKLNVFHWHLTDDQGWRLEIKRYPKLTEVGAWRIPAGAAGRNADGGPRRYGGFYTQAEAREIVAYAAARHITVVPEIEMPGHAQAAIAAYPQFGVTGATPPVSPDWGVHPYLYNVDDATFAFLQDVLDEVMAVFPGRYIHVGGDEAVKDQWRASAQVQAKRRELGLQDEMALQSWFIGRIGRHLTAHGRTLIGWDEILEGGLPPDATVMSWRGTQGAVEAARHGHDVVMSPSNIAYLNRMQGEGADEPPSHDYPTPLKAVYDFEPVPAELDASQARHVLGAQANLWTEHVRTWPRMQHMTFPRLAALAEGVWTPPPRRDWNSFLQRLAPQMQRYARAGVVAADSAFAVKTEVIAAGGGRSQLTLSNQSSFGAIHYTLDGSEPSPDSPRYRASFDVAIPTTLKAAAFHDGLALSATRTRTIDAATLRTRPAEELQPCSGGLVLRLEDDAPADGERAVLPVDIMDACWIWKDADLDGIRAVRVDVANLPYNFQLGADIAKVKRRAPTTPDGELVLRRDGCEGPELARVPLAQARHRDGVTRLEVPLAPSAGRHDVCFHFTGRSPEPLWAIDEVQLLPTR